MREIIPRLLWTGNAFDARDLKKVFDHRIEAIIDVALEEPPLSAPQELVYCRFPLTEEALCAGGRETAGGFE